MISRITGYPHQSPQLSPHQTAGAQAQQTTPEHWHLEIPPGPHGCYRLAQLDDYTHCSRRYFPDKAPFSLSLRARASANHIAGTWGFGVWNDPFSFSFGFGGGTRRLPSLPNAAWFFFAAPQNYLSLRDDLPTSGNLAAIFQSSKMPSPLLFLGSVALPLIALPPAARLLRQMARRFIRQAAISFVTDVTEWHQYRLEWEDHCVHFFLDGLKLLESQLTPHGPLGLVIWVDNQYFAWPPHGRLDYGNLGNTLPSWIEIEDLSLDAT